MKENVVIGKPDIELHGLFAHDKGDWDELESKKTFFTNERFLPKLLVEIGIAKSNSEVRKNRPELVRELNKRDFMGIKWGKKFIFIAVFPENE